MGVNYVSEGFTFMGVNCVLEGLVLNDCQRWVILCDRSHGELFLLISWNSQLNGCPDGYLHLTPQLAIVYGHTGSFLQIRLQQRTRQSSKAPPISLRRTRHHRMPCEEHLIKYSWNKIIGRGTDLTIPLGEKEGYCA
ncbi:uncharacterized protein LOC128329971 isoform X2 [Hemicordylus capensis]|uniref:uncharacterized protein LOC128329971 isoform X2 n=1 Tax=Hemicordylus capensis TaxID=884348 RepID=UPI0023029638|nr:uncharacterized protein LOC128329971 isoform X2 [Hemicordylus capensis]